MSVLQKPAKLFRPSRQSAPASNSVHNQTSSSSSSIAPLGTGKSFISDCNTKNLNLGDTEGNREVTVKEEHDQIDDDDDDSTYEHEDSEDDEDVPRFSYYEKGKQRAEPIIGRVFEISGSLVCPVASSQSTSPSSPTTTSSSTGSPRAARVSTKSTSTSSEAPKNKPTRLKKFKCTVRGCNQAFTRPVKLEEHIRTHTGERPFKCTEYPPCNLSFTRSTNLQAHVRMHLPESAKPFACSNEGCDKRFWTGQHLKRHEESCETLEVKEAKAAARVIMCEEKGCGKIFATRQKLKTHSKVHDNTRYTCCHASHISSPPTFATWTLLRAHISEFHPPTCPYPTCANRKPFNSRRNLKAHLKVHHEREEDERLLGPESGDEMTEPLRQEIGVEYKKRITKRKRDNEQNGAEKVSLFIDSEQEEVESENEDEDEAEEEGGEVAEEGVQQEVLAQGKETQVMEDQWIAWKAGAEPAQRKRRRTVSVVGKNDHCLEPDCGKSFKTPKALRTHHQTAHLGRRPFICPHVSDGTCDASYGHKHLLKRHLAKKHPDTKLDETALAPADIRLQAALDAGVFPLPSHLVTALPTFDSTDPASVASEDATNEETPNGTGSVRSLLTGKAYVERKIACWYAAPPMEDGTLSNEGCEFRFSRAYDLRRHLKKVHNVVVDENEAKGLVEQIKRGVRA